MNTYVSLLLFTLDVSVVYVNSSEDTNITFDNVTVEIDPDSFQGLSDINI